MQVCTSLQTDNHASTPRQHPTAQFFTGRICPSCRPTNSVKEALKAIIGLVYNYRAAERGGFTDHTETVLLTWMAIADMLQETVRRPLIIKTAAFRKIPEIITVPGWEGRWRNCDARFSVFVCLRVYLRNYVSDFTNFARVAYYRCLIILWRRCDTLCTFDFVVDVIFAHDAPHGNMSIDTVAASDVIASLCAG